MANLHFGNIGDVWKHLALAEILEQERPGAYWDSHAGAAEYSPVTRRKGRRVGVHHFRAKVGEEPVLRESAYARLLENYADTAGRLCGYPGSPTIAMSALGGGADYLFCETDEASLASIERAAKLSGFDGGVETVGADGIRTLEHSAETVSSRQASSVVVLIDPSNPLLLGDTGYDSLELFVVLAKGGFKVVLWYPDLYPKSRRLTPDSIRRDLEARGMSLDHDGRWWGDVTVDRAHWGLAASQIRGSGLLAANLSPGALGRLTDVGERLAAIYETGSFRTIARLS